MFHSFLIGFHWIGAPCIPPPDAATNAERMTAVNMAMLMVSWWWRDELMLIQNASNIFTWSSHALMHSCSHALMLSCTHALMHSCSHALMLSCTHALMHSGSHVLMHPCSHALMLSCSHALRIQMTTPWVSAHDHMAFPWHPHNKH